MALLAAYSFDEASGTILDASGNGRDVTFGGSLTRVTGHTSTGLSQSTTATDSAGPALSGMQTAAYTIMGWVKRTSNSQDGWLEEFKQSGSGDRGILFTSGNIQSRCKNVAGTVFTVQTTQPTANTAYHFAATNDGTTLRLFINGTEVGTGTAFSGGVRTNSTSSSFFDGVGSETWLDDARYYDTALNAAAITALMGSPVVGGTVVGTTAETDAAQPVTRARATSLAPAAETAAAQPVTRLRAVAIGTAAETDAAQSPTRARLTIVGAPVETNAAQAAAPARATAIGVATEIDAAQPAGHPGGTPVAAAGETDTAQPVTRARLTLVGTATEADTAPALVAGHTSPVAVSSESDTAQPAQRLRAVLATPGGETDTALPVTRLRVVSISTAVEVDAAQLAFNPNAVIRDLDLEATVEPGRFRTAVEPARFNSVVERDRFRTEMIAS